MFKCVLHRPTMPDSDTKSGRQDPLAPYKLYHARPAEEDILHPWSPNTAFSGSWYAYLPTVQKTGSQRFPQTSGPTGA